MMRKLFALIMTLALLAGTATAEGLFAGLLATPTPAPTVEEAPSYAALKRVNPNNVTILEDGSCQQYYGGVFQEDFNEFGVYLAEKGYSLPSHEYVGDSGLAANVVKGDISFKISYNWNTHQLYAIYPKSMKVEAPQIVDHYGTYTRVWEREYLRINDGTSKGSMMVHPQKLAYNQYGTSVISFACYNESTGTVNVSKWISNVVYHYITLQNSYHYTLTTSDQTVLSLGAGNATFQFMPNTSTIFTDNSAIRAVTFKVIGYDTPFVYYFNNPNDQ